MVFFAAGTDTSRQRYSLMYEPLPLPVENSIQLPGMTVSARVNWVIQKPRQKYCSTR